MPTIMPPHDKHKPDKPEKLAADLALVAMRAGAYQTMKPTELAQYCLDVAKTIDGDNPTD